MQTIIHSTIIDEKGLIKNLNERGFNVAIPHLTKLYSFIVASGGCNCFKLRLTFDGNKRVILMQNTEGVVLGYNCTSTELDHLALKS